MTQTPTLDETVRHLRALALHSYADAVESAARTVRAKVAEEIAQAIEADDGFDVRMEQGYAARIAREHGKEQ